MKLGKFVVDNAIVTTGTRPLKIPSEFEPKAKRCHLMHFVSIPSHGRNYKVCSVAWI